MELTNNFQNGSIIDFLLDQLIRFLQPNSYRASFDCRRGKNSYPLQIDHIAYFFYRRPRNLGDDLFWKGISYQKTLDQLMQELSPKLFFRANRKSICAKDSIKKYEILAKSKIRLFLNPENAFEIIVSSEKSANFKKWIGED